jgi:hypothetical protein
MIILNFFFEKKSNIIILNNNLKKNWKIVFHNSFIYKFICTTKFDNYNIYFLRKNRSFNKGRYSRNRQNYRTGVYWCLYLNIVAVVAIYYFFYRFSFNFGYIWWIFAIGINCFFFSKFVKYKLYILQNFWNNITTIFFFYLNIALNLYNFVFIKIFKNLFFNKNIFFLNLIKQNNLFKLFIYYFLNFYYFLISFLGK